MDELFQYNNLDYLNYPSADGYGNIFSFGVPSPASTLYEIELEVFGDNFAVFENVRLIKTENIFKLEGERQLNWWDITCVTRCVCHIEEFVGLIAHAISPAFVSVYNTCSVRHALNIETESLGGISPVPKPPCVSDDD